MKPYLFLMVGVEPMQIFADDRRAAILYGCELLGYPPGMPRPRCTAVRLPQ